MTTEPSRTLTDVLAGALRGHAYTYPDSFCECGAWVDGYEDWLAHMSEAQAPAVEAIVAERVAEAGQRVALEAAQTPPREDG